ncbi:MAG: class I SAM-dependent methyltransferase [Caldilinea sp. CFX5]|nr:class I SAM-dependent methyltransferase [Caldilinea sp. CFX5]
MLQQPKQFSYEYASIFQDASVVAAYPQRAPYPAETFEILAALIDKTAAPCRLLDAGCGTGQMTAGLLAYADHIDAVDISAAMIEAGKQMPYGADPKLNWITGGIEAVALQPPYALIVAAVSLHWMPWAVTLPRLARVLSPNGYLALVENPGLSSAWDAAITPIIAEYAMNRDFQPYSMITVAQELERHGLFRQAGVREAQPVHFRQPVDDWITAFHATNGFSRERMGEARAAEFDQKIRQVIEKYCPAGEVEQWISARVVYGKPLDPNAEGSG